ncbi:Pyridoxal phosphate homeostasis protein [subsurface metagenome]
MNENYLNIITKNVTDIQHSFPSGVLLVAAAKTRSPDEVKAAIHAGIKIIGYNYVQEAERMRKIIENPVQWHMIGHLQRNKVKKAVKFFDMIETIDSVELAEAVNKECVSEGKIMPVLIEINSGKESNKTGVLPENVDSLIRHISGLPKLVSLLYNFSGIKLMVFGYLRMKLIQILLRLVICRVLQGQLI